MISAAPSPPTHHRGLGSGFSPTAENFNNVRKNEEFQSGAGRSKQLSISLSLLLDVVVDSRHAFRLSRLHWRAARSGFFNTSGNNLVRDRSLFQFNLSANSRLDDRLIFPRLRGGFPYVIFC